MSPLCGDQRVSKQFKLPLSDLSTRMLSLFLFHLPPGGIFRFVAFSFLLRTHVTHISVSVVCHLSHAHVYFVVYREVGSQRVCVMIVFAQL